LGNIDITNFNVGPSEVDPAMIIVVDSVWQSTWTPQNSDISNFGGFLGIGQTPTMAEEDSTLTAVSNVFWKTIYKHAWTT
jgi:hypothetical protein